MFLRADVKCYLCGLIAGQIEAKPGNPLVLQRFQPAHPGAEPRLTRGGGIRCGRCGGGVFFDEWETIRPVEVVTLEPSRRGRPRKHPLTAAS